MADLQHGWLRHIAFLLLGSFISFLLLRSVLPLFVILTPSIQSLSYDIGVFGAVPSQRYRSLELPGPQANIVEWNDRCESGHVLLTPNGNSVAQPGPMMLDARGELVWTSNEFQVTANLQVQRFNGEDYLTFWSGEKAATSGRGRYYMLNSHYQNVYTISAIGAELYGDLHEFQITPQGTALLTIYNTTKYTYESDGTETWIVDNLFQELDVETGELLLQWRASDHFLPNETRFLAPFTGHSPTSPFDFYHLNSVDKHPATGNYLISSRHFHTVTCISPTGLILWTLGGTQNDFTDLSNGEATNFHWQHDARWVLNSHEDNDDQTVTISLFDNGKAGAVQISAWHSRGMLLRLDLAEFTAELIQQYTSLDGILSASQGAMQILPQTDQVFIGWGSAAAWSEFALDGELLCEVHLGAGLWFWWERMKSYRARKVMGWVGRPTDAPRAVMDNDFVAVSWNGATEVAYWGLEIVVEDVEEVDFEGQEMDETMLQFEMIDIMPKMGFETVFSWGEEPFEGMPRYRVVAMDSEHRVLAYSNLVEMSDRPSPPWLLSLLWKASLLVGIVLGLRIYLRCQKSSSFYSEPRWMSEQRYISYHLPSLRLADLRTGNVAWPAMYPRKMMSWIRKWFRS